MRVLGHYYCGGCITRVDLPKPVSGERKGWQLKSFCQMRADDAGCLWCPNCQSFSSQRCDGPHPMNAVETVRGAA